MTAQVSHAARTAHLSQNTTSSENTVYHEMTETETPRTLRSYVQQFQKKANHSPGGAASSTRSSKDANSVKVSRQPSSAA